MNRRKSIWFYEYFMWLEFTGCNRTWGELERLSLLTGRICPRGNFCSRAEGALGWDAHWPLWSQGSAFPTTVRGVVFTSEQREFLWAPPFPQWGLAPEKLLQTSGVVAGWALPLTKEGVSEWRAMIPSQPRASWLDFHQLSLPSLPHPYFNRSTPSQKEGLQYIFGFCNMFHRIQHSAMIRAKMSTFPVGLG